MKQVVVLGGVRLDTHFGGGMSDGGGAGCDFGDGGGCEG